MSADPRPPADSRPLVVGLGSPDRGDDAFGPAVTARVAGLGLPARVVEREDPTGLLDLWDGVRLAVVVDAVRTRAEPGSLAVLEAGAATEPPASVAWARAGSGGTHAFGLEGAVALARALHRLPDRVVVVGVSAVRFDHGAGLSEPVAAAVDRAVEVVSTLVLGAEAVR